MLNSQHVEREYAMGFGALHTKWWDSMSMMENKVLCYFCVEEVIKAPRLTRLIT